MLPNYCPTDDHHGHAALAGMTTAFWSDDHAPH